MMLTFIAMFKVLPDVLGRGENHVHCIDTDILISAGKLNTRFTSVNKSHLTAGSCYLYFDETRSCVSFILSISGTVLPPRLLAAVAELVR